MALDYRGSIGATGLGGDRPSLSGLAALIVRPSWHADALCKEYPQVNWFPELGQSSGPAKAICARCAVAFECRKAALDDEEPAGIWGGLARGERKALLATTRKSGRPPEEPAA